MLLESIFFTWMYGVFWATYPLFTENRFVLDGYLTTCTFDYTNQQFSTKILILSMFLGGFVIPLLLIIALYTAIWFILNEKKPDADDQTQLRTRILQTRPNKKVRGQIKRYI